MPTRRPARNGRAAGVVRVAAAVVSLLVLVTTGYAWGQYRAVVTGIHRSGELDQLAGPAGGGSGITASATQNILVMGLDSRLDENGNPLPPADYAAMDTGGADVGGYNANVLMLLHVPGDGSRATALSIPRDDYVALAGHPDGQAKGKIKQAYGLAFDQQHKALVAQGVTDRTALEQRSRDAGRDAEIATVSRFLGGVPIDHFVEVTLVAFYQIAQVVAPITVCLAEDTRDTYSGADFHSGYQQISAAQAVAFVRQRRDYAHPRLDFTDLDRERRQQAFIASLAYQLKQAGTFADPAKLAGLIRVAQQNTAVDPGLDLLALAGQAASLTAGNITFSTLPVDHFGTDPAGEDVNIVDLAAVQADVAKLLGTAPTAPAATATAQATVDVFNSSAHAGLAATVAKDLTTRGYTAGATGVTAARRGSVVEYPPGGEQGATALADALGIDATAVDAQEVDGHLRVVLGAAFRVPAGLVPPATRPADPGSAASSAAPSTASSAASSPAGDALSGGAVPCVK